MKLGQRKTTEIEPGTFKRPAHGVSWRSDQVALPLQGLPAWQSNGGLDRDHNDRLKPYWLEVTPPKIEGQLTRIHFVGVFGLYAEGETDGTVGATISVGEDRQGRGKIHLTKGRHYHDSQELMAAHRLTGDGASIETVGECEIAGATHRVDLLTIDIPSGLKTGAVRLKDCGTPASFLIFDVFFELVPTGSCPFKSRSGGVALSEVAAVVRLGDRDTLRKALDQLEEALSRANDLDEAKGEALTFIAVVTAAMLEMGGSRAMHRVQLESARKLDRMSDVPDIMRETRTIVENIASSLNSTQVNPSAALVDRAITIVNRNFATNITDGSVARQLNVSTSHFRFLFREITGQPFHKYLIALRLEKAKKLLLEASMPISDIAHAVGFNGLAHFSRAFTQRYGMTPSNMRRKGAGRV